jgi:exosortase A-associated hydrolase 2
LQAFFFPSSPDVELLGIFRGPATANRVWVLCPPFAEEEKSARRVLTLLAQQLEKHGEASLLFSFRGTGDSQGEFVKAHLAAWKDDLIAAVAKARELAPQAEVALLGVRLGASLALQQAESVGAQTLVLIEPLLSGRSFLMQQNAKKQIRAQMTGEEAPDPGAQKANADDLDGWALGAEMRAQLSALDLKREASNFTGQATIFQVGPRPEVSPALQNFADGLKAKAHAVVMPPFWNLIDYSDPAPLLTSFASEVARG